MSLGRDVDPLKPASKFSVDVSFCHSGLNGAGIHGRVRVVVTPVIVTAGSGLRLLFTMLIVNAVCSPNPILQRAGMKSPERPPDDGVLLVVRIPKATKTDA